MSGAVYSVMQTKIRDVYFGTFLYIFITNYIIIILSLLTIQEIYLFDSCVLHIRIILIIIYIHSPERSKDSHL